MKKALFVLHQKTSEAGDIGKKLKKRGFIFDYVRPPLGDELPKNVIQTIGCINAAKIKAGTLYHFSNSRLVNTHVSVII